MSSPTQAPGEVLIPELAEYERQFAAIKRDGEELVTGLSEAQFNWQPEPGRWSIAECLMHLNITGERYLPAIDAALAQARASGARSQGPFRYGWFAGWLIRNTEPPPKRKFRAPRRFVPFNGHPVDAVLPTFKHIQDQLRLRLQQANGLDLARTKVVSPVTRLLRLPLGACFAHTAAHERRHLWQAREVRKHPNFPAA